MRRDFQDVPAPASAKMKYAKVSTIRGQVDRRKWDGGASNRDLDFMMAQRDRGIYFLTNNPCSRVCLDGNPAIIEKIRKPRR